MGQPVKVPDILKRSVRIPKMGDPVERFTAMRILFAMSLKSARQMDPELILEHAPTDEDGWDDLKSLLNHHTGLAVARSRLIGVCGTLLKNMSEIYDREIMPLVRDAKIVEIGNETDQEKLKDLIRGLEEDQQAMEGAGATDSHKS